MRRSIIGVALFLATTSGASAHAIFPNKQTVRTMGDRAFVKFSAANARSDVNEFLVEVFDGDSWAPSMHAVPLLKRLTVNAPRANSAESTNRNFTVLVDLEGEKERRIKVCTRSLAKYQPGGARSGLATRVCGLAIVKRVTAQ